MLYDDLKTQVAARAKALNEGVRAAYEVSFSEDRIFVSFDILGAPAQGLRSC